MPPLTPAEAGLILNSAMPRDDLHKRIEALNKRPLRNLPEAAPDGKSDLTGLRRKLKRQAEAKVSELVEKKVVFPLSEAPAPSSSPSEPVVYSRSMPRPGRPQSTRNQISGSYMHDFEGPAATLEETIEGIVTSSACGAAYYHIEMPATDLDDCACDIHACFCPLLGHPGGSAVERVACVCRSGNLAPEEVVFVDLETTGLSMTPVFLIGTMECGDCGFTFKQYLARDYSEEPGILSAFAERLSEARMIVTFNGKSFDLPYLRNRAVATGIKLPRPKSHLDLLHEARRHFGRRTPNHKLQTLEQVVCGRCRQDDIPGHLIPAAYHDFVRTGDARKIGLILRHNLHDLLTMADLMRHMWQR